MSKNQQLFNRILREISLVSANNIDGYKRNNNLASIIADRGFRHVGYLEGEGLYISITDLDLDNKDLALLFQVINANAYMVNNLTGIRLGNNKITIPPVVSQFKKLASLSLQDNKLAYPPNVTENEKLCCLNIVNCSLDTAPDLSQNHEMLLVMCQGNNFRVMPIIAFRSSIQLDLREEPTSTAGKLVYGLMLVKKFNIPRTDVTEKLNSITATLESDVGMYYNNWAAPILDKVHNKIQTLSTVDDLEQQRKYLVNLQRNFTKNVSQDLRNLAGSFRALAQEVAAVACDNFLCDVLADKVTELFAVKSGELLALIQERADGLSSESKPAYRFKSA